MPDIGFSKSDQISVKVSVDGEPAGLIGVSVVRPGNDAFGRPLSCEIESVSQNRIEWHCKAEGVSALLELRPHEAGFTGQFSSWGRGHAIIKLVWELPKGEKGFPFVPAFMYGFNEGGGSPLATYPQLNRGLDNRGKMWLSDEWLIRTDRSSHGVTSAITPRRAYAMGGRDICRYEDGKVAEKTGIGISSTDPHRLTFSLGFGNFPFTYSANIGRNYCSRPEGYVYLDKGKTSAEFFLFAFSETIRHKAASRILRESYSVLHDQVTSAGDIEDAICAISDATLQYAYCKEVKNFHVVYTEEKDANSRLNNFNSGWSGGVHVAYPLLVAGQNLGNDQWLSCARDVISNIAENAVSPSSGLFFENYDRFKREWNIRGWWHHLLESPGHSGYVNGHICHYMLLGYMLEKEAGIDQSSWLSVARSVLEHVSETQRVDGCFGYTLNEKDGSILDPDGFSGCWFTPAFATLYRITDDSKYLDVACRAIDFYRNYIEDFRVYGGPHDSYKSPDQEGIVAWINAARILHEVTGKDSFLEDLLLGLEYEFSWRFAYNVVSEVEPLKSSNWCSCGGSVTSVNNSHIHPMGSAILSSILYAAENTSDSYIRSRLVDTVRWTLNAYLHCDGQYDWGKKGMVCERFCYTDSLLNERYPDGSPASTWFTAQSWTSGSVLEGLVGKILEKSASDKPFVLDYTT